MDNSFIILGDPHLGKNASKGKINIGDLSSRVIDQFNLLDWVYEQSEKNNHCPIIITGDIFDEPTPTVNIILKLKEWLEKCSHNDITVHMIAGNHDIYRTNDHYTSYLDLIHEQIDNVYFYKYPTTIFIGSYGITLLPYRDRRAFNVETIKEAQDLINNIIVFENQTIPYNFTKICIGHLAFEGAIPVGDELDNLTNEIFLKKEYLLNYDYTWLGHIHKPQVLSKKPYISHIGSMDISDFGEINQDKKLVVFKNNSFEEISIPTRKFKNVEIIVPEKTINTNEFIIKELEKVSEELKDTIVKVSVNLDGIDILPANKKEIEKFLYSKNINNLSSFTQNKKTITLKKDNKKTIDAKIDILSAIKKYSELNIEKNDQENFEALCIDIMKKESSNANN